MTVILQRVEVALRLCPGKGRGIFAVAAIPEGTLIDWSPALLLSSEDCDRLETTGIGDYYFGHPDNDEQGLLPLGVATLLNHAEAPNAETQWKSEAGIGWLVALFAIRDIKAGEEITRRYRCSPWFDVAE